MVKTKRGLIAALIAVIWAITAVLFLIPNVSAASTSSLYAFEISGGTRDIDYTYTGGVLTVETPTEITIRNVDPNIPITNTIVVKSGVSANIILNGVNIDVSTTTLACAFKIEDNSTGNVTITLADGSVNVLKSGYNCAGLQKNGSVGSIEIKGTGSLEATGGSYAAGIGGGWDGDGTNITISGGNVTATGRYRGSGIGGGAGDNIGGSGTNITISGGNVTAKGGEYGAGIGGGAGDNIGGSGSNITINGGIVTATGSTDSAGIGGGGGDSPSYIGGEGSNITINGGIVTAKSGSNAAGIGGGRSSNGSNIKISGGSVKATGYANDIGGGYDKPAVTPINGSGKNVYLLELPAVNSLTIDGKAYPTNHGTDGKVYVYLTEGKHTFVRDGNSETKSYGINSGNKLEEIGTAFTVTGNNLVYGTDYTYKAGSGVLRVNSDKEITIKNTNPAEATTDTIYVDQDVSANIILDGVNIDVSASGSHWVIDSCAFYIANDSIGNVTITLADGSKNVLKSGDINAGLMKNDFDDVRTLTIKGGADGTGSLEAIGGPQGGAGIGGGNGSSSNNITISGGNVTAKGGSNAAGIGGGNYYEPYNQFGNGTNITISGGTVTATGGENGAGIGGGNKSNGSNIKISGGSVKAIAGTDANAIGGGKDGNGSVIPTDGSSENVYLLELPAAANPITIDGKAYPTNHGTDGKIYVYLTEGEHTIVSDGNSSTKMYLKKLDNTLEAIGSDLKITGENLIYGTDYTYPASTGVLTILSDKEVTISGATTTDTIVVDKDKNANITLDGVDINVSGTYFACAFKIEDDSTGNVTITLADGSTNILKSGEDRAGLQKNGDNGKLTIQGNGKLTATGGDDGAGIGGGDFNSSTNITISGGTITANGGKNGAGIGGGDFNRSTNITISGGTVTATGGEEGAGIGGGRYGDCLDIIISGGSVKVTADTDANAIGGGYNGNGAVTPTLADKTTPVYLLEIANPDGKAITINEKAYPTNHNGEKKIYAYLPAKTAADPNTVTVGESTSKYYYDTANSKWYGVADIPDADDTEFIYNGKEQTYAIPESTLYTIDGNKQKTPGDYTVTIALNDKVNNTWSDGTTDDKEYTFTIAKAEPTVTVTAKPTSDIAGKTVTVTASAVNPENTALDDIPDIVLTYKVGDGAETPFTDSFVIPEGTAIGTIITVKAKTAEDGNYKSGEAETKVNVSDCGHTDVQTEWNSDSTGHWHICNYCSENVDFAAHTFGEWKITVPATETSDGKKVRSCTVCGYTEEETVKFEKTDAEKAAEEAEKALDELTAGNDTTAEDIINSITGAIGDDITAEVTEIKKVPATENSEGSITVVITITDSDGNTETVEKTFVIGKLPKTADNDKPVYYPVSISGNVTADRTSAKAGETVNVSTAFGYDIIVTSNGRQIARIIEKGSFVMPNGRVYITVVQNDTLAVMSNAWNHSYVYSYDSDMNRIKISSDSKRGTVTIKLGSEYAGREFIIYKGRNSTKVKVTEGVLDENGAYSFKSDDGRNYTLVIK